MSFRHGCLEFINGADWGEQQMNAYTYEVRIFGYDMPTETEVELAEQHNKLQAEADRLIEQVKQLRNGATAIRGQLQLIEEIEKEGQENEPGA